MINLLPWRDQARLEQQRQMLLLLTFGAGFIIAGCLIWRVWLAVDLQYLQTKNQNIQQQFNKITREYKELLNIKANDKILITRFEQVAKDYKAREQSLEILGTIANAIPRGIYLVTIEKTHDEITLTGIARDKYELSDFTGNLDQVNLITNSTLAEVKTDDHGVSKFVIKCDVKNSGK